MVDNFSLLTVSVLSGLMVIAVLTTTAFVKISVVLFIIRNALGLQQTPSGLIIQTFAVVLAAYISMPVFSKVYETVERSQIELNSADAWVELGGRATEPIQEFLAKNTEPEHKVFFVNVTKEIWKNTELKASENDLIVLVPSFMVSELTKAFQIGFLLYLPFIAIDLVLTVILMAMGMMMVPPTIIGVPFKLLLFVAIGGWTKLVQGLVLTYG